MRSAIGRRRKFVDSVFGMACSMNMTMQRSVLVLMIQAAGGDIVVAQIRKAAFFTRMGRRRNRTKWTLFESMAVPRPRDNEVEAVGLL